MGWLWFVKEGSVEFIDGTVFVIERVEEHVPIFLFVRLKYTIKNCLR